LTKKERRTFLKKSSKKLLLLCPCRFQDRGPEGAEVFLVLFFKNRMPSFPFSERCDADAAMAEEALTRTLDELMLRVI
jgi:hypothetical protein